MSYYVHFLENTDRFYSILFIEFLISVHYWSYKVFFSCFTRDLCDAKTCSSFAWYSSFTLKKVVYVSYLKRKNKEMKLVPYITIILYRNVYDGSIIIQNKVASAFSACAFRGKKVTTKSTLYDKIWRWEKLDWK